VKPDLVATAPGQVWSWDITKLLAPQKWTYFYLYVVLGVFGRYVVALRLETRESATLADELFATSVAREGVDPKGLTVQTNGGLSMTSKTLAQLFADVGIAKLRSHPHVSTDNTYSEAQFKTLKYALTFSGRVANIQQACDYIHPFLAWYNEEHRHTGIALLTPSDVHHGRADDHRAARSLILIDAW